MNTEKQTLEDINISYNEKISSYVIDVCYRSTDANGNVDLITISDLPIPIFDCPSFKRDISLCGRDTTIIDLGFGELTFHPEYTKVETRRIHTEVKEMTVAEIEKQLGYSIKIVKEKENEYEKH